MTVSSGCSPDQDLHLAVPLTNGVQILQGAIKLKLQAAYGAVDLLVVEKFGSTSGLSAVSTGSQVLNLVTFVVIQFATAITVLIARYLGEKKPERIGSVIGGAVVVFAGISIILFFLMVVFAHPIAVLVQAPTEAVDLTTSYVRICGGGMLVIVAYNLIGCIFRGLGDSRTPLITVAIACVFNVAGDLLLCAVFGMGTAGAAIATVFAQIVSVIVSFILISKKDLPFTIKKENIRIHKTYLRKMTAFGAPIALQDLLVSISFLIILAIVNGMGVIASAGVGVAEKSVLLLC